MKISDLLSEEGVMGTVAKGLGVSGAGFGQGFANLGLNALGFKHAARTHQEIGGFGDYQYNNATELIKQLGIKPNMDFEINPGEKVKITKVDGSGATYQDNRTGMPLQLGKDALITIAQRQRAMQTVAQMGKPGATTPAA